jgi:hypothetical protein
MCQLPADHYVVKSHWSQNFLVARGIAAPEQVSILSAEETSLLRPGVDSYADAYFEKERLARQVLGLKEDRLIVLVPHHVAFIWEVRQILRVLAELPEPVSVVVQASPHAIRRQFTEPELIARAYEAEIERLDHFMINTQIGVGLMAQIADLVISPFAGTTSEGAALRRKPVIISQLMTDESSDGEFLRWQPDARQIPAVIEEWRRQGILGRARLGEIARQMLAQRIQRAA